MRPALTDRLLLALDRRLRAAKASEHSRSSLAAPADARTDLSAQTGLPAGVTVPDSGLPVVWLAWTDAQLLPALAGAASHLAARFPDHDFVIAPALMPAGETDESAAVTRLLDQLQPVAVVMTGSVFCPVLAMALAARNIPVLGAMLRMPQGHWMEHRLARPLVRRHLGRFRRLLAEDLHSLQALTRLGARADQALVGGVLSDPVAVPPGDASEMDSLTGLMRGRPVWCASALPLSEVALVAEAQRQASRRSLRLLLVVVPETPAEAPELAQRLTEAGLICGLRSQGEDPEEEISAYVADLEGELGLWLRLAPVTYIGGTMSRSEGSRSPIEAAALGSAVLHGPEIAPYAAAYGRLAAAKAARMVADASALADEIDLLTQPENAAIMAHAGWEVATAGDEAAEALAAALEPVLLEAGTAG